MSERENPYRRAGRSHRRHRNANAVLARAGLMVLGAIMVALAFFMIVGVL